MTVYTLLRPKTAYPDELIKVQNDYMVIKRRYCHISNLISSEGNLAEDIRELTSIVRDVLSLSEQLEVHAISPASERLQGKLTKILESSGTLIDVANELLLQRQQQSQASTSSSSQHMEPTVSPRECYIKAQQIMHLIKNLGASKGSANRNKIAYLFETLKKLKDTDTETVPFVTNNLFGKLEKIRQLWLNLPVIQTRS